MPKLRLSFVVLGLFSAWLLRAQDPNDAPQKRGESSEAVIAGKAEFGKTCGFCHGANGRGASGPDLIHSSVVSHDVKGDRIGPVIRDGRAEKGMPAFPNETEAQIRSIAEFLHAEARLAATAYQRGPGDYPLAKLLVGDAEQGKHYFEQKCASCHSPSGDLAHVAAKYKPIDLQTRIAFPTGLKPTVTAADRSGKRISGTEVYADEFVVTLRDKDNRLHTFDRTRALIEIKDPLAEHVRLLQQYTDADLHNLFAYLVTFR